MGSLFLRLLDSHIVELGESGECVAGVLELSPSVEHDDRTGFAVIAGPASQSGADPGGVGERAFWMRIFLTGGLAFELGAKRLQQGRIFELEGVARRSQPLDGAAIARMDQLLNRDGGDQRGGGQFAERLIVGDAQRFDIKALRLHRTEQLLDRPAASIKIGDFERLLHNANRTGGYETPMNGFAWRGIDLPEVDDIHCDRLGPALVAAVLRLDYFHAIKAHRELGLPRSPPRFGGQRQEGLARRRQRVDARKQKRIALNAAVLRRAQHKIDAGRAQGESREYVAFAVGDHRYLLRVRADLRRRARPLDPAPAFLLFDRPRPSLRLAPALALQKLSVDKTKNRPVLRVHRDCGMQIETAAARRSDDRRVLDRQHMPAHATRPGARAGGGEHLLGRHRLVAQKTGQTNFPSPIPAQPTHANPIAARRDKAAMQKDPPFSRRRSPNRPSPSSSIANLPTNQRRESDFKNHRNRRCVNAVAHEGGGGFLDHARLALMQIDVACEAARRTVEPEKPGFVVGFLPGQEVVWLSETLRILREEAPEVDITLSTKSSPELADALMQGKVDVALLRRETQTAGLAFKLLIEEPLIAILPANHRLAARKAVRPQELARETFISSARLAPVLRSVINDYATKVGITLKQNYDAETVSGGMSLVASTGGFTLVPLYVRHALISSVVARPLSGEVPTIDLMMGYNKSNASPLLKRFLARADELTRRPNLLSQ